MRLEEMIVAVQKKLGVTVDGKAGPQTWSAIYAAMVSWRPPEPGENDTRVVFKNLDSAHVELAITRVDERSEKAIATLRPNVQPMARALVHKAGELGISIKVISATRTYKEQDALYAQGRTTPGAIVTNCRGGYSNHNFGIAFDIGVFDGTRYLSESPLYLAVGALGMDLGLEWGGNWKTFVDRPHFQLRPDWAVGWRESDMLAELRRRVIQDERATA